MSRYMLVLILAGSLPFVLSFWPKLKFYRNSRALAASIFGIVAIFGVWDVIAVNRHHWYFDPSGVGAVTIFNLPLEEVLFFVVIPFCCIFTWEALKYIKGPR
ncbi:MAG: lycopene cyclase domain-containing protein [Candidatus Omnitrophica bacterium]|nr:lycopene cyclase domain-containing protein [Candidatus Omnitrophota bacterium]